VSLTHIDACYFGLETGCDKSGIRAMLTIGRKPGVDWTFLRTYSLQNYFLKSFSFILVFVLLILFKILSYSLLFPNFRWSRRTARNSTRCHPVGQMAPRDVLPQQELQHDSPQYIPQEEDPFEIVVMVPTGEDTHEATKEARQLSQNNGNNDNHDNNNDHEEDDEEERQVQDFWGQG
jgi:hypothetical protein